MLFWRFCQILGISSAYLRHNFGISRRAYLGQIFGISRADLSQGRWSRLVVKIGCQDRFSRLLSRIKSLLAHLVCHLFIFAKNHCFWAIFWIVFENLGCCLKSCFLKSRLCECVRSIINFHPRNQDVDFDTLEMFFSFQCTEYDESRWDRKTRLQPAEEKNV